MNELQVVESEVGRPVLAAGRGLWPVEVDGGRGNGGRLHSIALEEIGGGRCVGACSSRESIRHAALHGRRLVEQQRRGPRRIVDRRGGVVVVVVAHLGNEVEVERVEGDVAVERLVIVVVEFIVQRVCKANAL